MSVTDSPLLMLHTGHTFDNCFTSPSIHLRLVGRLCSNTRQHRNLLRKFRRAMRIPPSCPHQLLQSSPNAHSACLRTSIHLPRYFVPFQHILIQPMGTPLFLSPTLNCHPMRIPSLPWRPSVSETAKTVGTSSSPVLSNRSLKTLVLFLEVLEK